ncbi:MAG TPA: hypothetical protein VF070_00490 [Streptosporangiaceae bacterium]
MKLRDRPASPSGRLAAAVGIALTAAALLFTSGTQAMATARPAGSTAPAAGTIPQLGFIKTGNTGSGSVEVHVDSFSNGLYHRVLDAASDFPPGDARNGTFALFGTPGGVPELGFVQTANTGSGTVEVHVDSFSNGSYHRIIDAASDFSPADARNGTFELSGAGGPPVLDFIKTVNTGSGTVEVHEDTLSNGSYHRVRDKASDFSTAAAPNGSFTVLSGLLEEDLGFVQTANTGSGTVEMDLDSFNPNGPYTRDINTVSDFSPAAARNGSFELFGDASGLPELGLVQTANTGSGTVEVHVDNFGTNSTYFRVLDAASDFGPADTLNGSFELLSTSAF